MLDKLDLEKVLFLDIETVSQKPDFNQLNETEQTLWTEKSRFTCEREGITPGKAYEKAGIMAEFGQIICISVGFLAQKQGERIYRTTSFYGKDEAKLLRDFANLLNNKFSRPGTLLCGHNAKEFDFPYIARRMLINGIRIPNILNLAGKKPWEVSHLDTLELWKFGDYKHFTSLKLLAHCFGISTPKDDIDGSMVNKVYWEDEDLDKIELYCRKDTLTVAQVMLRYMGLPLIEEHQVVVVTEAG
jgi:3'-5' exonuclease